jgi:hypothetical protein
LQLQFGQCQSPGGSICNEKTSMSALSAKTKTIREKQSY